MDRVRWFILIAILFTTTTAMLALEGSAIHAFTGSVTPHAKVTNPHGPLAIPCQNCHTYTSWKPTRAIPEFSHDNTRYPLRGMHENVACKQCHTSLVFRAASTHCADCHADIHRRQFGASCENCHSVKGWQVSMDAIRNHQNRFPLVGAHALADCEACHKGAAVGQFKGLSTDCYSCHVKDYQNPAFDHVGPGFPTTCQSCHTMDTWFGAKFDHLRFTGFALTGMHATLDCNACHLNNKFKGTAADCFSCHNKEFIASNNPSHLQLGLPHDCGSCHTTSNWLNAKFDHATFGHYPLTGFHAKVACEQCHLNGKYAGTPTDCYSCHKQNFDATTNPNHMKAGYPTDCSFCHTTTAWIPSSFNHGATPFPLTGAHTAVPCAQCHMNNVFKGTPTDCYSCHKQNYTSTTNPNHVQSGFPTDCAVCHTTVAWIPASFDHNKTAFPLTGAHSAVACAQCHINGKYKGTPTDCYSCHQVNFAGTTNPNHLQLGLPHDCSICHSTVNWLNANFDHATFAHYPLTGFHATVPCLQCHINGKYAGTPSDCYSCHKQNYDATTNPNHGKAGFPTDCSFCHSTTAWSPSSFDHSKTIFPLTGAHVNTSCALCHVNGNYTTLPTDCYGCHKDKYVATTDPNHINAGFPTTCAICHTTVSWAGAVFDHNKTPFPLTGAHTAVACAKCHINSVYAGTPTDCYACHKAQYTSTTNPNHISAGFPSTCAVCHTTASWLGATFNHTWFDTHHGGANGVCATCHTNSANYAVFTCTNCHGKSDMDQRHSGVQGYVYNSVNCYACHKGGGGGGMS